MSTLINKVKEHISDNRGKYGAATGAGVMYGASKIDSPLLNQAGFNILAKGQNLALDTADKIDPRATAALNDLGMHKIRQEDIDASNALYNSGVAKYINPNPIDMVNANEHSTELYNKAMVAKANAQDALVNAKNQGQDYIDQGVNYIKGLNPFTESAIHIPIKDMLMEGYTPEEITEGIKENIRDSLVGAALLGSVGAGITYDKTADHFKQFPNKNITQEWVNKNNSYLKNPNHYMSQDMGLLTVTGNGKFPDKLKEEYAKNGPLTVDSAKKVAKDADWSNYKIKDFAGTAGALGAALGGYLGARRIKNAATKEIPNSISFISRGVGKLAAPAAESLIKEYSNKPKPTSQNSYKGKQ